MNRPTPTFPADTPPSTTSEQFPAPLPTRFLDTEGGRIAFDYDMKIAEPFEAPAGATPQVDMWPLYDALATRPLLILRGETSDILESATAQKMAARPGVELVTIPRIGHAPTLDEPESVAAIERLLAKA